jgi:hypothetical protein
MVWYDEPLPFAADQRGSTFVKSSRPVKIHRLVPSAVARKNWKNRPPAQSKTGGFSSYKYRQLGGEGAQAVARKHGVSKMMTGLPLESGYFHLTPRFFVLSLGNEPS